MNKAGCILAMLLISGCAFWERGGVTATPDGAAAPPPAQSGLAQLKAAQESFQAKLKAAPGLTLRQLKSQWGQVQQAMTHNDLTVYRWSRTISVTPPPDAAVLEVVAAAGGGGRIFSCLAMFIVNQDGLVDDARSEGQCLDDSLIPDWRPVAAEAGASGNI